MEGNPNYFNNTRICGWPSADFCPVLETIYQEKMINYYIGHCSDKGSGEYGQYIQQYLNSNFNNYWRNLF